MAEDRVQRRLAAILAADVVGYSRLIEADEEGTRARFRKIHAELIDPRIAADGGRIVKTTGNGILVEFPSAVDAVRNALAIQSAMAGHNAELPEDRRMVFRVGINLGDVIIEDDDIHGDGVNVAARLEGLCGPGEVYVSGTVHDHVAGKLSAAFDDLGAQTVKNIAKPVQVFRARPASVTAPEARDEPSLKSSRPSIAVLPFANMSGDPEQEYFSDGISEDIITALSRIRWFLVIVRNSSFSYKGTSPDIRHVARELDVRYVLEGSVRKAANRVRITAQLIDAADGSHIWAERYDRDLDDIFALQDEITETVVRAIEPELSRVEQERARRKRSDDLDAWDCYQRGMWHVWRSKKADNEEAQRLFRRAMEIDPHFASGYAGLATARMRSTVLGIADQPAEEIAEGMRAANTALSLDERDAAAHVALGMAAMFRWDYNAALDATAKAIDINPNYAFAHLQNGLGFVYSDRPEEALPELALMERLSPRDPMLWLAFIGHGIAYLTLGDDDAALSWTRKSVQEANAPYNAYMWHAIMLAQLGRTDEARNVTADLMRLRPDFSLKIARATPSGGNLLKTTHLDSLREAGVPE